MSSDQQLFTGTAYYYAKYRPGYPSEFFDYVVRSFDLNGTGRLLDIGCGTGQLTIPFSQYFEEIIGLDPDKEMLDEVKIRAEKAGVKNIRFVQEKAENITDNLGVFRLTTIGTAFHWLKQTEVLKKIYDSTEPNGGVVIVNDSSGAWREKHPEPWKELRKKIIQKYLGEKRRAGNALYTKSKEKYEDTLDASLFGKHEEWAHTYTKTWTLDEAINFLYSTSFASRRLFGDRLHDFEQELRTELLKLEPRGIFEEEILVRALIAKKK